MSGVSTYDLYPAFSTPFLFPTKLQHAPNSGVSHFIPVSFSLLTALRSMYNAFRFFFSDPRGIISCFPFRRPSRIWTLNDGGSLPQGYWLLRCFSPLTRVPRGHAFMLRRSTLRASFLQRVGPCFCSVIRNFRHFKRTLLPTLPFLRFSHYVQNVLRAVPALLSLRPYTSFLDNPPDVFCPPLDG